MKIIEFKCPHCGADLTVEEGRSTLFCQYCGGKLVLDEFDKKTVRIINDAELEKVKAEKELTIAKIEYRIKRNKTIRKIGAALLIVSAVLFGIAIVSGEKIMEGPFTLFGLYSTIAGFVMIIPRDPTKEDDSDKNGD